MRLNRTRLVSLVAVPLLGAACAGAFRLVPRGHVGIRGAAVLQPGWYLRVPYRSLPVIPSGGEETIDDLDLVTREGSALVFRLDLSYAFGSRLSPAFASDFHAGGLRGALGELARRILEDARARSDAESLLSTPSLVEAPLRAALQSSGVSVLRMTFRSPLGDEVLRRRASEAAMALVRPPQANILLIGWDGADWDSMRPLLEAGRMPHLTRLLSAGAHGDLRSYDPMFSPLLWTTIATGKAPTEHGIADFVVKDARSDARRPITSDFRKVKALWNVLTDFGKRSAWLAWWASYPAEEINGTIVSDVLASSLLAGGVERVTRTEQLVSPQSFIDSRRDLLVPPSAVTHEEVSRYFPVPDAEWRAAVDELGRQTPREKRQAGEEDEQNPSAFVARVLAATRTYHNLAKDLIRSGTPFVAVYYEGIDMMGHRFQHFRPPRMAMVRVEDYARFHDAVSRFYEFQDELLGDLLAATPSDSVVMLVSDHGFLTGAKRPEGILPYTSVQPAEWHRDWGIVAISGPGIRAGRLPPSSIYDVAPTLLYLAGLPLAADMPGRLLDAAFEPASLHKFPPTSVRSYELIGERLARGPAAAIDAGAMAEMMANLRALGYVGGETADPAAGAEADPAARESSSEPRADTQVYYHRNLAVSLINQGRYREAESELRAANERKPLGKTYSMLSEVQASLGEFGAAARTLEEGWAETPKMMEPSSLLWIIELHLLANDWPSAEQAFERWSGQMAPGVRLASQGRLVEAGSDPGRAAELYRQALAASPLVVRVAQRLHQLDSRAGRAAEIEPFLLATLEKHPQVDAYWDLAGQIALGRGDAGLAASRFQRALELQPDNGLYIGHFASASVAAGRGAAAREALAWADRFPPRDGEAWMALGSAWDRLGETDRALRAFESAKAAGLPGPGADLGAVLALARAGRRDEAKRVLDDVARRFPSHPAVRQIQTRLQ